MTKRNLIITGTLAIAILAISCNSGSSGKADEAQTYAINFKEVDFIFTLHPGISTTEVHLMLPSDMVLYEQDEMFHKYKKSTKDYQMDISVGFYGSVYFNDLLLVLDFKDKTEIAKEYFVFLHDNFTDIHESIESDQINEYYVWHDEINDANISLFKEDNQVFLTIESAEVYYDYETYEDDYYDDSVFEFEDEEDGEWIQVGEDGRWAANFRTTDLRKTIFS